MNEETQQKITDLQILEQNIQGVEMQRQALHVELNETMNALEEVKSADDEIYRIVGSVLVKTTKTKIVPQLEERKKVLELRSGSIEKQQSLFEKRAEELRKEVEHILKNNS